MFVDVDRYGSFQLDDEFLAAYRTRPVPWGFGALSWVTYKRTYSRGNEHWWQTCRRVVEGMITLQRVHCLEQRLPWDEQRARHFAHEAYKGLWQFKWTPPGRGLWTMGTRFMYERGGAALNNCGFVSTKDMGRDYSAPYVWMFKMSMLGVGVGFDTRGRDTRTIQTPPVADEPHVIGDSREGWAESLQRLLDAYVGKGTLPARWDYSQIRTAGTPLRSFGGFASGPKPLRQMLESLRRLYNSYVGKKIDSRLIVDTMNLVGRCVVAGGVRRSAQIAFGEPNDAQFLDLKQDPQKLAEYRWVSNHSLFAALGMDYAEAARRTAANGEPGYMWLDNARAYGRMKDPPNWADKAAEGSNPCVEQTLWDRELCCLVETYPAHHDDFEDYKQTLRIAYQYAKTVTLLGTGDSYTDSVMMRNRRIGCSMTGVVQALSKLGYRRFFNWCDEAYSFVRQLDHKYSDWLHVPRSIKTTSVKPSGTVSLLAGATPGVHWEHARTYIRRIRVSPGHPLVEMCREAGYPVEPDQYVDNCMVISFPLRIAHIDRRKADVPLWEKVDLASQMQRYWSDNQVSCTAEFDPETERDEIPRLLSAYEDRLKAIVFLPARGHGYAQPPYEEIDEARYEQMAAKLKPIRGELSHEEEMESRFCEGGTCELQ
jgi:ribonucleoside-triphosphate reductase (thioredoxin)